MSMPSGTVSNVPDYKYSQDFIAYFLSSPITHEPEFEIRIKADVQSINKYTRILEQRQVQHRQAGLPVFPPPIYLLLGKKSLRDALEGLLIWYEEYKSENFEISVVHSTGVIKKVTDAKDIQAMLSSL